jgi:hypothetical protein
MSSTVGSCHVGRYTHLECHRAGGRKIHRGTLVPVAARTTDPRGPEMVVCPVTDYPRYYHLASASGGFIPARIAFVIWGQSRVTLPVILACNTKMVIDDVLHHLAECISLVQMVERDSLCFPGGLRVFTVGRSGLRGEVPAERRCERSLPACSPGIWTCAALRRRHFLGMPFFAAWLGQSHQARRLMSSPA